MTDDVDTNDPEAPEIAPFQPSEEWLDAFTKQCTDTMRLDLLEYAKRRARGVGRAGRHVDLGYADDLVADVLADTLFGTLAWDHVTKTLHQHAEDAIRSRTRHDRKRAVRYQHHRIDAPSCAAEKRATYGLVEASIQQDRNDETAETALFATEVFTKVRELAAGDADVLTYLDALAAGTHTRADIIESTNMTPKTFRNARDRLGRLIEQLDHNVVPTARQARGVRA